MNIIQEYHFSNVTSANISSVIHVVKIYRTSEIFKT